MSRYRTAASLTAVLVTVALFGQGGARAQTVPTRSIDCGPVRVNVGDLVTVNVGNPGHATEATLVFVRLLDSEGAPFLESNISLRAGQSRTVRWPVRVPAPARQVLVRGELVLTGFDEPRLRAGLQVFGRGGLTYGPNVECSGDVGGRGPV